MKNKAFTLIELLAVIVILAIIALIATPIILNIINDSKKSSNERSIELYGKAVENAIGNYALKNPEDGNITLDKVEEHIKYKGNEVKCDTTDINSDGTVYLSGCKVDGKEVDYTYGKKSIVPVSFAEDDWNTIVSAVKEGNTDVYKVGDTREVDLGSLGKHTLRIANTSTPDECNTEGFSQTACGFVIEFADIITTHNMNSNDTNKGGWRDSSMRTYVNSTIYNALPFEIKENIIDTYVVSGHGSTSGETNFTTTDKLYLLSTKEVWGSTQSNDTSGETKQLDYYKSIGVTTANYSRAIKNYNGSASYWWLRSAYSSNTSDFYDVSSNGYWGYYNAHNTGGMAPAFRIG